MPDPDGVTSAKNPPADGSGPHRKVNSNPPGEVKSNVAPLSVSRGGDPLETMGAPKTNATSHGYPSTDRMSRASASKDKS